MTERDREIIGRKLIRALKKKWRNDGWIVCGKRGQIKAAHPSEVADILARIPMPRIPVFARIAAEEALKRMERPGAASKYLGMYPGYVSKQLKKPNRDGKKA